MRPSSSGSPAGKAAMTAGAHSQPARAPETALDGDPQTRTPQNEPPLPRKKKGSDEDEDLLP